MKRVTFEKENIPQKAPIKPQIIEEPRQKVRFSESGLPLKSNFYCDLQKQSPAPIDERDEYIEHENIPKQRAEKRKPRVVITPTTAFKVLIFLALVVVLWLYFRGVPFRQSSSNESPNQPSISQTQYHPPETQREVKQETKKEGKHEEAIIDPDESPDDEEINQNPDISPSNEYEE